MIGAPAKRAREQLQPPAPRERAIEPSDCAPKWTARRHRRAPPVWRAQPPPPTAAPRSQAPWHAAISVPAQKAREQLPPLGSR